MRIALLILILVFFFSCKKEKLPEGELLDKIVVRYMNSSANKYWTRTFVYEQQRLIKIIADMDGQVYHEIRFLYDASGKLIKGERNNVGGGAYSWTYEYDNQNWIIKINPPAGSGIYNAVYEYDAAGNVTKYSAINNGFNLQSYYILYEYDSKGNRVTREIFIDNNGTFQSTGKYSNVYDAMKNPFNRQELLIPAHYQDAYFTGRASDHNFLYEINSSGIRSAPLSYLYQKNGLPKAEWYTYVQSTDTTYYYYK